MAKKAKIARTTAEDAHRVPMRDFSQSLPMALLRAGVRLSSLIPPGARDQVNAELSKNGVHFDIGQLKPENLEELISHLDDLTVDVDSTDARVRVYCE